MSVWQLKAGCIGYNNITHKFKPSFSSIPLPIQKRRYSSPSSRHHTHSLTALNFLEVFFTETVHITQYMFLEQQNIIRRTCQLLDTQQSSKSPPDLKHWQPLTQRACETLFCFSTALSLSSTKPKKLFIEGTRKSNVYTQTNGNNFICTVQEAFTIM